MNKDLEDALLIMLSQLTLQRTEISVLLKQYRASLDAIEIDVIEALYSKINAAINELEGLVP